MTEPKDLAAQATPQPASAPTPQPSPAPAPPQPSVPAAGSVPHGAQPAYGAPYPGSLYPGASAYQPPPHQPAAPGQAPYPAQPYAPQPGSFPYQQQPAAPYPGAAYYPQQAYYQPTYFNPRLWQPIPGYGTPVGIRWQGKTWGLLGFGLINFILILVTLAFYRFWAKNELRSRLWSSVRFNGEPVAYRGTGWELFLGFVIFFLLVIVPVGLIQLGAVLVFGEIGGAVFNYLVILPVIIYLLGVGIYRAMRYRMRRTSWRGMRGRLSGRGWQYGLIYFGSTLLMYLLIGIGGMFGMWIMPIRTIWLRQYLVRDATFGGQPLRFFPDTSELYKHFAIAWCSSFGAGVLAVILMIVVAGSSALMDAMPGLGGQRSSGISVLQGVLLVLILVAWSLFSLVMYFYYQARKNNVLAAATFFEGGRLHGTAATWGMLWVWLGNLLIWTANLAVFGTPLAYAIYLYTGTSAETMRTFESNQSLQVTVVFGLILFISLVSQVVRPIMEARILKYYIDHLAFVGGVDLNRLQPLSEGADAKTGEGLAEVFDVDAF